MNGAAEETLLRKLGKLFPQRADWERAKAIQNEYGSEHHEKEPHRVRLAILKLAGPDLDQVSKYTSYAKEDYRDVLAWAEYPNQSRAGPLRDESEKASLASEDRRQYEEWLRDI